MLGVSGVFFSFLFYFEYKFLKANSVDPDQTPHSAASELGLHCLPRSRLWEARHIWDKTDFLYVFSNLQ